MFSFLLRLDGWLSARFGSAEVFRQFQTIDKAWDAASHLVHEGTLTPARLGHLKFRHHRANTHANRVVRRLQRLGLICSILQWISIGRDFWTGHPYRALFYLSAWVVAISLPRLASYQMVVRLKLSIALGQAAGSTHSAEFLLWLFLPREGREAAIGDTNEKFEMMLERFGARRAKLWYWGEVARSAWPLVSYLGERLLKWTFLGSVADWVRRS